MDGFSDSQAWVAFKAAEAFLRLRHSVFKIWALALDESKHNHLKLELHEEAAQWSSTASMPKPNEEKVHSLEIWISNADLRERITDSNRAKTNIAKQLR